MCKSEWEKAGNLVVALCQHKRVGRGNDKVIHQDSYMMIEGIRFLERKKDDRYQLNCTLTAAMNATVVLMKPMPPNVAIGMIRKWSGSG